MLLLLLDAAVAQAQTYLRNLRATNIAKTTITIAWDTDSSGPFTVVLRDSDDNTLRLEATLSTSHTFSGLTPGTEYGFIVENQGVFLIQFLTVRTKPDVDDDDEDDDEPPEREPPKSHINLPGGGGISVISEHPGIAAKHYDNPMHVDNDELRAIGVIDAVDLYGYADQPVETCYTGDHRGSVFFLRKTDGPSNLESAFTSYDPSLDITCMSTFAEGKLVRVQPGPAAESLREMLFIRDFDPSNLINTRITIDPGKPLGFILGTGLGFAAAHAVCIPLHASVVGGIVCHIGVHVLVHYGTHLVWEKANLFPEYEAELSLQYVCFNKYMEQRGTAAPIPGCEDFFTAPYPIPEFEIDRSIDSAAVSNALVDQSSGEGLANCMARTTDHLNFRASPGGLPIDSKPNTAGRDGIPHNVTLTALRRTGDWVLVDYHGVKGWISRQYSQEQGQCLVSQ